MIIRRTSPFSGQDNTMDLPVTQAQLDLWQGGELAQNVFSNLNAEQREFIMTGITPEEWGDLDD